MNRLQGLWERFSPYIVAAAVVIIIALAGTIVWQNHEQALYTAQAHAQSVQQEDAIFKVLNEHTNTLTEVQALRTEFTTFLNTEGPDVTAGQTALLNKLSWIECSLSESVASCGPRP